MDDLERMKECYGHRTYNEWSIFNCYPFFIDCKQTYIMTQILNDTNLKECTLLDIGAGDGNFILKMLAFGMHWKNITAVEYLPERYDVFTKKLPYIYAVNDDFNNVKLAKKYDVVTLMAVLTSITDNRLRYRIFEKALQSMSKNGMLIVYDYFDDSEKFLNENYRSLSLNKIKQLTGGYEVKVYKNVYMKSKYVKGLCKFGLKSLIPLLESLKIFNDACHFVVIQK